MDLSPFHAIDPCGYSGQAVTQARELGITDSQELLADKLARSVLEQLS
jgi:lipoyl(octanoyl) transferase